MTWNSREKWQLPVMMLTKSQFYASALNLRCSLTFTTQRCSPALRWCRPQVLGRWLVSSIALHFWLLFLCRCHTDPNSADRSCNVFFCFCVAVNVGKLKLRLNFCWLRLHQDRLSFGRRCFWTHGKRWRRNSILLPTSGLVVLLQSDANVQQRRFEAEA